MLPWARPLRDRRCAAVRESRPGDPFSGRCELKRGHEGAHALERGFYTLRWSTDWLPAVVLGPVKDGDQYPVGDKGPVRLGRFGGSATPGFPRTKSAPRNREAVDDDGNPVPTLPDPSEPERRG